MASLGEELPVQQARVRALMLEYRDLPGNAGAFAITMMQGALAKADQAIINGDLVGMIRSFKELEGFK